MKKRVWVLALITLLVFSIIVSAGLVAAQEAVTNTGTQSSKWLNEKYQLWLKGFDPSDPKGVDSIGTMLKWIFLILIIILIYSALEFAKFPEKAFLRIIL